MHDSNGSVLRMFQKNSKVRTVLILKKVSIMIKMLSY